jgi:hypothetical protein
MSAERPLLPLTKALLIIWALITIPGGLAAILYPPFAILVFYPPPLEPIPEFNTGLYFALALGSGVASVLALRHNRWSSTQAVMAMYFAYAIAAEYVAIRRMLQGPVPFQVWAYVLLGILYLIAVPLVWRRQ